MDQIFYVNTDRHIQLVSSFFGNLFPLIQRKEVKSFQENAALVYFGKFGEGYEKLVVLDELDDVVEFRTNTIYELSYVQPDFFLFQVNTFLQDERTLRVAGVPDLVVEVWSNSNSEAEKTSKFRLYSSSYQCEHWYLDQNSNDVECYIGTEMLGTQTIEKTLTTKRGLQFDLSHLVK